MWYGIALEHDLRRFWRLDQLLRSVGAQHDGAFHRHMNYKVTIATGPTSLLSDEARAEYEELLELLRQDEIDGKIAERSPSGLGVTWIEVTEIWLASTGFNVVAGWAIEKALDAVSERSKQWVKRKRQKKLEKSPDQKTRPQSIVIKSLTGEPERKIEVDSEGNVTEYHWVKVERGEGESGP